MKKNHIIIILIILLFPSIVLSKEPSLEHNIDFENKFEDIDKITDTLEQLSNNLNEFKIPDIGTNQLTEIISINKNSNILDNIKDHINADTNLSINENNILDTETSESIFQKAYNSSYLLSSVINYQNSGFLEDINTDFEAILNLGKEKNISLDLKKTEEEETSTYILSMNHKNSRLLEFQTNFHRKGLLKEYNYKNHFQLKTNIEFSKTFKIPVHKAKKKDTDNDDNEDNNDNIEYRTIETTNTNPSTSDIIGIDLILFIISILAFIGTIIYRNERYNS